MPLVPPELEAWFTGRGWRVRRHQAEMLAASDAGRHALLVADTGAGKTLAGFLPTLAAFCPSRGPPPEDGLHTLYVSPLKALAHDVQRNLVTPVEEIGLPIRIETRSGDTPSDRKKRQRTRPPHVLLTTPESLSLLLSYPDSFELFAGLRRVVVDEVHAFATGKRGDLLALALARLQAIAPDMQRAALSATVADPEGFRGWLAPWGEVDAVAMVEGEKGAPPEVEILLPEEASVPWGGHAAIWAIPQLYELIKRNKTTLVFTNTRFLAEFIFQELWDANDDNLPIAIHHGSLSKEARRKVEGAMRAARAGGDRQPRPRGRLGRHRLRGADGRAQGLVAPAAADRPRQPPARLPKPGDPGPRQPIRVPRGAGGQGRGRPRQARRRGFPAGRARRARAARDGLRL